MRPHVSEIMCVLRYCHHQIIAKRIDRPQVAAELKQMHIASTLRFPQILRTLLNAGTAV